MEYADADELITALEKAEADKIAAERLRADR
jgi:hypothetical protein